MYILHVVIWFLFSLQIFEIVFYTFDETVWLVISYPCGAQIEILFIEKTIHVLTLESLILILDKTSLAVYFCVWFICSPADFEAFGNVWNIVVLITL